MTTEKEYYTLKEVAEKSNTSYGIVKRDIDRGKLAAYRVGRKYFIAQDTMADYLGEVREKLDIEGYTIKEIMERIPLSYAFLMDLIKKKKLPAVKVGRQYIVSKTDFAKFMADKKL